MKNLLKNRDFLWNTIGTFVYAIVLIVLTIAVSRINGQTSSGNFTFSFNIAQIFWLFATFGIRNFQVTDIKNEYNYRDYFQSRIFSCTISLTFAIIFCVVNHYDLGITILIITFTFYRLLDAFSDVLQGFLQSNGRLYQAGISLTVKSILGATLFILVDYFTRNLFFSGISLILVNVIWIGMYEIERVKEIPVKLLFLFSYKLEEMKIYRLFSHTWPLMLQLVFSSIFLNITRYFIQMWHGNLQAYFGIIFLPVSFMSIIVNTILAPQMVSLAKLKKTDINLLRKRINKILLVCFMLGIFTIIIAWLIGVNILTILFSINVLRYKIDFVLILVSGLLLGVSGLIFNILTIFRSLISQVIISGASVFLQTLLAIILVRDQAIIGAGISLLVSSTFLFIGAMSTLTFYIKKEKAKQESCLDKSI
ncbi:MAG TPA: hypothetical protein VGC17_02830 [Lactovum miscens]|uniref:hypothetical protein n=1 Tax=Lactovum miscens TaxID=190387 RepID=UPI002EDB4047